jgi:hypothetical protein
MSVRHHLARAVGLLVLLLSPVGAPLLGMMFISICATDTSIQPDGPFAMDYVYCGVSRPLEHFYETAIFLPIVVFRSLHPAFGVVLTLLWFAMAVALLIAMLWHLLRAIAGLTIKRL